MLLLLRVCDRILAFCLLLVVSPVILALAVVVQVLSGRAPFVAHLRVGRNGVPFRMLKLRTMWGADPVSSPHRLVEPVESIGIDDVKPQADPRVTSPFAAWCRTHSIDELPQLWHVVRGEMSLVGPRPVTESELVTKYGASAATVVALTPGMTGLWQVMGRNNLGYPQRVRLDLFLCRNYCWGIYWRIIWRTLPRLIDGAGAW